MDDIVERLRMEATTARAQAAGLLDILGAAADEIERLRRAVNKMADAAGPAWTPRWVLDAPWRAT